MKVVAINHLKEGGRPLGKGLLNCYFAGHFCAGVGVSPKSVNPFLLKILFVVRGKIRSFVLGFTLHACCICLSFV